jgi:hypothetical protein
MPNDRCRPVTVPNATAPTTPTDVVRRHRIGMGLLAAAVVYLVAAGMMGLVFASRPPAQLLDALADHQRGQTLYRWGFVGASLLAPALVTLLMLLAAAANVPPSSARRSIASVLLGGYVTLATIAYSSQYTFLPRLVTRDPRAAALWYFHDVDSIPYAIDLAGYTLLGLGAILLASLLAERHRRWLAGWLVAMGSLSIAAFALHAAGFTAIAGVASLTSAACTLPIVVLAAREGRRLREPPVHRDVGS